MQSQKIITLTEEQRESTLKNWFKALNLTDVKVIMSQRHPEFSKEIVRKYNLKVIANFGDYYWLIRGVNATTKKPYFFCIMDGTKFVALNLRAFSAYYHLFENEVEKIDGYDFNAECQVFVCTTFTLTLTMRQHIPADIFPCLYRFIPLTDLYMMLGSKNENSMYGLAYDYSIERTPKGVIPKHDNGLEYAVILDTDIGARMLNASENDVIVHKRLLWESGIAYVEEYRRCVKRTSGNLNMVLPDGKCFGNMNFTKSDATRKTITTSTAAPDDDAILNDMSDEDESIDDNIAEEGEEEYDEVLNNDSDDDDDDSGD